LGSRDTLKLGCDEISQARDENSEHDTLGWIAVQRVFHDNSYEPCHADAEYKNLEE
jgi:hypothetical protein